MCMCVCISRDGVIRLSGTWDVARGVHFGNDIVFGIREVKGSAGEENQSATAPSAQLSRAGGSACFPTPAPSQGSPGQPWSPPASPAAARTWRRGSAGRSRLLQGNERRAITRGPSPARPDPRPPHLRPSHLRGVAVRGQRGDLQRQPPSGPPHELVDRPAQHPLPHCQHNRNGSGGSGRPSPV